MTEYKKFVKFNKKIVILGFGSVGQGVLPLLLRHIDITPDQIKIITADENGRIEADFYHVPFIVTPITKSNYKEILGANLNQGDFLTVMVCFFGCVIHIPLHGSYVIHFKESVKKLH